MKHYTKEEWCIINKGDQKKFRIMEEHLQECEECLEIFLNLIDSEEIAGAEEAVPLDFTPSVMQFINRMQGKPRQVRKKPAEQSLKRQSMLVYYAAAVLLTLVFMGGGVFQALVNGYTDVAMSAGQNSKRIEQKLTVSLSDRIAGRTSQWLHAFENQNNKEVR